MSESFTVFHSEGRRTHEYQAMVGAQMILNALSVLANVENVSSQQFLALLREGRQALQPMETTDSLDKEELRSKILRLRQRL